MVSEVSGQKVSNTTMTSILRLLAVPTIAASAILGTIGCSTSTPPAAPVPPTAPAPVVVVPPVVVPPAATVVVPPPAPAPVNPPIWVAKVASMSTRAGAQSFLSRIMSAGYPAEVVWSSDYPSMRAGYWVAVAGPFSMAADAWSAARTLGGNAYVGYLG
jgi:hypothetical protein